MYLFSYGWANNIYKLLFVSSFEIDSDCTFLFDQRIVFCDVDHFETDLLLGYFTTWCVFCMFPSAIKK